MQAKAPLFAIVCVLPLAGCGMFSPQPVHTSDITVEQALTSVGDGLSSFKKKLDANDMKLGLYVDTINLELDLTTDQKGDGKLSVDFSKGLQLGPQLGMEQTVDASRGSKLVITLKQAMVQGKQDGTATPTALHDGGTTPQGHIRDAQAGRTGAGTSITTFGNVGPTKVLGIDPRM
ncbi:conserved protein of unknown function [Burkholderia multivorans]